MKLTINVPQTAVIKVNNAIHPDDDMAKEDDPRHYFLVCADAISIISHAVAERPTPNRILDLPCGFGRVARGIRALFPGAEIIGCDILPEAVKFCHAQFGLSPAASDTDPTKLDLGGNFDVIWSGSLITHLDYDLCAEWMKFYISQLSVGGVLLITAHGEYCQQMMRNRRNTYFLSPNELQKSLDGWDEKGYGFGSYCEGAPDTSVVTRGVLGTYRRGDWGISIVRPEIMFAIVGTSGLGRVLSFEAQRWDKHHDIYVIERVRP